VFAGLLLSFKRRAPHFRVPERNPKMVIL